MLVSEQWLPLPSYEECYEVSDFGRVRSLDRVRPWNGTVKLFRGRILRPGVNSTGRLGVCIHRDGGRYRLVHQLVMEAFVGPCPDGMEVCHNNGDHLDNRLSNLRYDTRSANVLDRVKHGTHQMARKTHCKRDHSLAPDNVYMTRNSNGSMCRRCKQCDAIHRATTAANKKARLARVG